MSNKQRTFKIFKYLWNNTDEEHPVTIKEILEYLEKEEGIKSNRETIADDVLKLQDAGFDIICNRKRQNQYFVGDRTLELSEVKIIIDAIQLAKFISNSKSKMLIDKLSSICGYHHSEELKRNLYVDGKVKTDNEKILYTIDIINNAINRKKTVSFKYIEYTPTKEKKLKHNGQEYIISPYDLVWSNDAYYVMGWSRGNRHDKVVKFRVDRITDICERRIKYHYKPEEYNRLG